MFLSISDLKFLNVWRQALNFKKLFYGMSECVLCHDVADQPSALCLNCYQNLPWNKRSCLRCARPQMDLSLGICNECLLNPPYYDRTICHLLYQPPVTHLITRLKFHDKLLYAKVLSQILGKSIQQSYEGQSLPEAIIPVPLHVSRIKQRGFNQANLIAGFIKKKTKVPILLTHFYRSRATKAQSLLPARQRKENIQNVFQCKKPLEFQHVAILDDVMTTGHTINEFAKTVKLHGAKRVDVWVCARQKKN